MCISSQQQKGKNIPTVYKLYLLVLKWCDENDNPLNDALTVYYWEQKLK